MARVIGKEMRQGWPAQALPEARPPEGWSLALAATIDRLYGHRLSPDGQQIAFFWQREGGCNLWLLPTEGGWPWRLTLDRPPVNWWEDDRVAWTPDGQHLVFGAPEKGTSQLWIVAAKGGIPRRLTSLPGGAWSPHVSPDGTQVAFVTERDGHHHLAVVPFSGGWPRGLTSGDHDVSDPQWSPDGHYLAIIRMPPDDLHAFDLWLVPTEGGKATRLTPGDGAAYRSPRWSPDGRRIALLSNRSGFQELWMWDMAGNNLHQVTRLHRDVHDITWSPNGQIIAGVVNREGAFDLALVYTSSGQVQVVCEQEGIHARPQWTPEGNLVIQLASPQHAPELFWLNPETGERRQLTATTPLPFAALDLVTPQRVCYPSLDGLEVPAMLYRPTWLPRDQRGYPAIVHPHGGPTDQYGMEWDPFVQYLVAKGYVVLCPNFRGSTGYGKAFEDGNHFNWGVGDLQDCLAGADFLRQQPDVDGNRLAIWGQSYGGYLTTLTLTKDPEHRFHCGVALYSDSNIMTSWAVGDRPGRLDLERNMGRPGMHRAEWEAGSPIHFVENLQVPILILHGERDKRVHINESEQLVEELQRLGKHFEYVTYPEEAHGFLHRAAREDAFGRIERFLDWYLL